MVAGMSTWVLDLDGVVWRGDRIVDGSDRAVSALLAAGHQVVACTNHAQSPAVKGRTLARLGVPEIPVVTSAEAAASRCPEGSSVLVLGDESLVAVIAASGLEAIDVFDLPDGSVPRVDVVVVGGTHRWDRSRVGMAAAAVRLGALFLATNDDPTYPVCGPDGYGSTGKPRPLSSTRQPPSGNKVTLMRVAKPAMASSTALSTTSQMRWCRPARPVDPMYMPGRFLTGSRPSSTWMSLAL